MASENTNDPGQVSLPHTDSEHIFYHSLVASMSSAQPETWPTSQEYNRITPGGDKGSNQAQSPKHRRRYFSTVPHAGSGDDIFGDGVTSCENIIIIRSDRIKQDRKGLMARTDRETLLTVAFLIYFSKYLCSSSSIHKRNWQNPVLIR